MQLKSIGGSNISSRRNRNRQYAVLAVDMAVTFRQCRNHHILHTQIVDADCRTDNVHYRINGSHFVEMNLFNRKPMGLGFRLCHNAEHGPGHFLHPFIGIQTVYDMINVVEVPVNVGMRMTVTSLMTVLMLMTVLGLCFAIALGTASLGLSLALGAFLAGLLLSGSEYSLNVLEGILPFKDVFTSLFFISVGMLLDVGFLVHHLDKVFLFAALLIFLKSILSLPPMLLVGYPLRVSILAAMSLAQIGEFSFVLARSAVNSGLMDNDGYQMFLAASIVTMMLTPTVMEIAPKVASFVSRHMHMPVDEEAAAQKDESLKDHLIIVGFGVGGKHLARTAREAGIPYVILEMNPDTVSRYGGKEPIHGGDASKPLVLEHFGIQSARVIAVVISDPSAVRAITAVARKLNPKVHIVVRTRFLGEVDALRRLGADDVIPEDFETSIEIFSRVLGHYLVPRQTIERFVNSIRHEYYNMARQLRMTGMDLPSLADEVLTGLEVVACKVEPGCVLDGKRLMDTSLRKKYGVTVVGIRHAGQIIPSPGGDAFLHGDDTVFLFASPASLTTVMPFFRTDPEPEKAEDL